MNWSEPAQPDPTEIETLPAKEGLASTSIDDGPTDSYLLAEEDLEEPYASFSARFAALTIDLVIIGYMMSAIYRLFGEQLRLPLIDWQQWTNLKHTPLLGATALLMFGYFFIFEGILARTPGKLLCGLSVAHRSGGPPSLFGVLIRNIVRFIDILLFPVTGFGLAEASHKRQRLGDWLGNTTVRRSRPSRGPVQSVKEVEWASVTRRSITLLLDLVLFVAVSLFFLLALPVSQEKLTQEILLAGPVLAVAYWVICETLMGGTPIKLLLGLRVVNEQLRPVGVAGSLLRNVFRILDHNPLGYLCAMLSSRRQRPGDLAAQTSVIRVPWSLKRLLALLISGVIITGVGYYGIHNPDSFIRQERVLKIGPWTLPDLPSQIKYHLGMQLRIHSFSFGPSDIPSKKDPLYTPGEIVYLSVNVSGYIIQNDSIWLQQDILVTDPNGESLIDMLNVINRRYPAQQSGKQEMSSSFLLPLRIEPGQYQVRLRIRDRYGNMYGEAKRTFLLK